MAESELRTGLRERLKTALLKRLPVSGRIEPEIRGLALTRADEEAPALSCFYNPMVALVVQGFKRSVIGGHEANYGPLHCVTVGVDMPGVYQFSDVSPEHPFLSLSVKLDRQIIAHLMSEDPALACSGSEDEEPQPVMTAAAGDELLDAFARLLDLMDTPQRIPVLAPLILREIHYYLLTGSLGRCLRLFSAAGTQSYRIAEATAWLRQHYAEPFDTEALAARVNMAPSTFNRHFRAVTSLSPLQFQKRLRLYEAERLMLQEGKDAGTAALMVGYESVSQFSREYKRQFGAPPRRDISEKRS